MKSHSGVLPTSLLRSTSVVSLMTFLSRAVGFIRDMVIAQMFGASGEVDAFLVAFKIPNFMRRLFAEGAFSQAFVPVLAEFQKKKSQRDVCRFIAHIFGNLLSILLPLTIVVCLFSETVIMIFAPGFEGGGPRFQLASWMLKLTFPYLMLISLTAFCGAILNTYGRFAVPAFTPVLLNLALIFAALVLTPYFSIPITALAFGVLTAGIIQFLFQFPFLKQNGLLVAPEVNWQDAGVKKVLKLMAPALIGVSVAQINLLLDTFFASFLEAGSVSWLYYADRLINFPLGVFGVAIATVILPHLSRKHAEDDFANFSRSVDWGMRLVLIIALPSMVSLTVFASPIVMTLFAHGKFDYQDSLSTVAAMQAFSIGLPAFMLVKVFGSAFYAKQDIKTPVKIAIFSVIVNTLLCLILIGPLAHVGLAMASSISGLCNASLLLFVLYKRNEFQFQSGWLAFLAKLFTANLILAAALVVFKRIAGNWFELSTLKQVSFLMADVTFAIVLYFILLYVQGFRVAHFRIKQE
jgi:putative peptidoglycan lipid II flippase